MNCAHREKENDVFHWSVYVYMHTKEISKTKIQWSACVERERERERENFITQG